MLGHGGHCMALKPQPCRVRAIRGQWVLGAAVPRRGWWMFPAMRNTELPNPCEQNSDRVGRRRRGSSPSDFLEMVSFPRSPNDILGFLMKTMTGKVMSQELEGSFNWVRG